MTVMTTKAGHVTGMTVGHVVSYGHCLTGAGVTAHIIVIVHDTAKQVLWHWAD